MMTSPSYSVRGARPLPLVLLGSICLNIAFAGYVAMQAWRGAAAPLPRAIGDDGREAPETVVASFAARLPPQDADILWETYHAREPQILEADAIVQSARLRVLSALGERDLNRDALRAAVKQAMESRLREGELLADGIVDALASISPEGRRQLTTQFRLK